MSISVALMVLCILLTCSVGGRVISMWVVAQISKQNKPVLHKLVKSQYEAGEFVHAICELPLQIEIHGNVIAHGRCVKSRNRWLSAPTYIGLLAKPYDLISLAQKSTIPGGFGTQSGNSRDSMPESPRV
ncbi:hypothetical protein QQX98_002336 [Neonectria punicea]|uniref:Uncharacterized protein n=1 Tax=Neonectria punicea TaxID=979145 RepID=A0ABR1HJ41_9HYPO